MFYHTCHQDNVTELLSFPLWPCVSYFFIVASGRETELGPGQEGLWTWIQDTVSRMGFWFRGLADCVQNHGIISAVSWGLLLPLGVMAARYIRPFSGTNPAWFYIHVTCQCTGYVFGVVAWAMGMRLNTLNEGGLDNDKHRNLGISIFALATLQVHFISKSQNQKKNIIKCIPWSANTLGVQFENSLWIIFWVLFWYLAHAY